LKILTKETCPGCKKEFESSHELENLEPKINKGTIKELTSGDQVIQQIEKPKDPEVKIETKTVIEDFKPNYECPNGDCDIGVHKNTNYKKKPKGKCTNCGQFTKHDKGTCPWCKGTELEELDEDELNELGIVDPVIDEHEGHIHE